MNEHEKNMKQEESQRNLENFFIFTDFKSLEISAHGADNCAHIANALLREWLKEHGKRVYGSPHITKQQLANAWNKFVWGNNHTHSADSILFNAFCKEIGV